MVKKSSIVIVSHYAVPHIGGIEQVVEKQEMFLGKNGYDVTVVATASHEEVSGTEMSKDKSTVIRLPAWTFFERKFFIPFPVIGIGSLFVMWRTIRNADIVHIHDVFYVPCWFAGLFASVQKKQMFLTQHVAVVEHANKLVMYLQRFVYGTVGRFIFYKAKKIIVYNNRVKSFYSEKYNISNNKIIELRNGVDLKKFGSANVEEKIKLRKKYNLPENKPIVIFVGRIVPKKGADIAYGARSDKYEIVFVGSGEVNVDWVATNGVNFLGSRNQNELVELYKLADVFIFPANGEIFTLTMQEAMSSGLPIVTAEDSAYDAYNVDKFKMRFVNRNSIAFRNAIEDILSDNVLRKEMGKYSTHLAHTFFDWKKNISKLAEVYGDEVADFN